MEKQPPEGERKTDYKLLVDPQIKKGQEKLMRYNGDKYNTANHGQGIVVLRDPRPRMNRLWTRRDRAELPVPRYKVDEWYVGSVPPREVTFSRLNDNITKEFMEKTCGKFGKLERVRVYHHPKTQKHMGLSKIVFSSIKSAAECVKKLHMTSMMGNVIHAQIDCKGEILNRLYQKIVKGEIMAQTLPDVIRHTHEGRTMSNIYKASQHPGKKERRKSSQDDPRKLKKQIHSQKSSEESAGSAERGPATPTQKDESQKLSEPRDEESQQSQHNETLSSSKIRDSVSEEEQQLSEMTLEDAELKQSRFDGNESTKNDSRNIVKEESVSENLDTRISSLFTEQDVKKEDEQYSPRHIADHSCDSHERREIDFHPGRDAPTRFQHSGSPLDEKLRMRHEEERHHHHPNRIHSRPGSPNDPYIPQRRHERRGSSPSQREPRYYDPKNEPRNRRFEPGRHDRPPHHDSRIPFPPHLHRRESFHRHEHDSRRPSERFERNSLDDHDNLYSQLHSSNHEAGRQKDDVVHNGKHQKRNRRREERAGERGVRTDSSDSNSRPSDDFDPHTLSLDQRLREITGEAIMDCSEEVQETKPLETEKDSVRSNGSSVDMEISEGESDHERREQGKMGPTGPNFKAPHPREHPNGPPREMWNEFHPRLIPPPMNSGRWEVPPHPPNFFPGFKEFPRHHWNNEFHPKMENFDPHPMHRGFNVPPSRIEDRELERRVMMTVIDNLKAIVSRDLNRKVIETMAFKVYEMWWDGNSHKQKTVTKEADISVPLEPVQTETDVPEPKSFVQEKKKTLLNAFDPLNWAKNSFEMDGFRIGLGLRSAISKMPSFRVKRPPSPPPEKLKKADKGLSTGRKHDRGQKEEKENERPKRSAVISSDSEDEAESDEEAGSSDNSDISDIEHDGVLDVDDIFSESEAERSDSDSEAIRRNENEQRGAVFEGEERRKRKIDELEPGHPDMKKRRVSESSIPEPTGTSHDSDTTDTAEATDAQSNSFLPTSARLPEVDEVPHVQHIHPKKRLLQDIAEKAKESRSEDETLLSDKEKAALEAMTDLQMHPERRMTSYSLDSNTSAESGNAMPDLIDLLEAKEKTKKDEEGENQELEAVAALLSIKQAVPSVTSPTAQDAEKLSNIELLRRSMSSRLMSTEEREQMADLAEEHNYFAVSHSPRYDDPTFDPLLARIYEEHCYSQPPYDNKQADFAPFSDSKTNTPAFQFNDSLDDVMSTAERVKLRREHSQDHTTKWKKSRSFAEKENLFYEFIQRKELDELVLLYRMWNSGLDLEDLKYLRRVYEDYLEKPNCPSWVNDSHWVPYLPTYEPRRQSKSRKVHKRQRNSLGNTEEEDVHATGSARTEGYYQLAGKVKLKQRRLMYGQGNDESTDVPAVTNGTELVSGAQNDPSKPLGSRETRHFMRRIAAEVGSDMGDLFKYNQLMFRKKAVKFKRSSIHGWGLFAQEDIGADEMVIEYVGQVVRTLIAERREVHYTEVGIGSSYLFRIDSDHIIDATKCGNYARFMNHSCNPSCYAKVITVDMAKKIVIYSKGPIRKNDEITYDYKFPLEDEKIMCYCGAENCRRTLN